MHLYVDIGDASSSLWGSTSSFFLYFCRLVLSWSSAWALSQPSMWTLGHPPSVSILVGTWQLRKPLSKSFRAWLSNFSLDCVVERTIKWTIKGIETCRGTMLDCVVERTIKWTIKGIETCRGTMWTKYYFYTSFVASQVCNNRDGCYNEKFKFIYTPLLNPIVCPPR